MPLPDYPYILVIFSLLLSRTGGQRGDVEPEIELRDGFGPAVTAGAATCSCSGSVVAAVIVTALIIFLSGGLWWYFKGRRKITAKPDREVLGNAAYDNPQFQGDDLDQNQEGQTRITIESGPQLVTRTQCTTTTIATNTTSTLERGKTTLERVMAAIIRGSRSESNKKTKDDSYLEDKDVIVPLQSHDFAGLGFTVQGNLKEGLYVKEVLSRGPASQSGQVIQGDRIIALTILTEHIVFKDALTILSCASPYPVLLHLKKRKLLSGSFSTSSSGSKGKLNNPALESSLNLMHPAFRSQSQGDLSKAGDVDVNHLNLGNVMPILGRSPGISQKIPKNQYTRADRKAESRHSERAIDVPGVTVKSGSVTVDIEGLKDDKKELANVQVHRSMTSTVKETSTELPMFEDSHLSETTENLRNVEVEVDYTKPNPKTKFGVKVFPDLTFVKGTNKVVESNVKFENKETKIDIPGIKIPKISHENEAVAQNKENSQIELNIGASALGLKKDVDSKSSKEVDSDGNPVKLLNKNGDFSVNLPDISLPSISLSTENSQLKESDDIITTDNLRLQNNELAEESFQGKLSTESSVNVQQNMPDISLPTLNIKSSSKSESDDNITLNKQFDEPDFSIPSVTIKSNLKSNMDDNFSDNNKKKSKYGFKMSDISLPSFNLKVNKKTDSDSDTEDDIKLKTQDINLKQSELKLSSVNPESEIIIQGKESEFQNERKHDIYLDMPDISMTSFSLKETSKIEDSKSENSEEHEFKRKDSEDANDTEKDNKKSKYGFKFGMPDLNLPSFGIKTNSSNKNTEEKEIDNEQKLREPVEEDSTDQSKSNFEAKLDMPSINIRKSSKPDEEYEDEIKFKNKPDITLHVGGINAGNNSFDTSFNLEENMKSKFNEEAEMNRKENLEYDMTTFIPDLNLDSKLSSTPNKKYDIQEENIRSKHGFKITVPDINMPSNTPKDNFDETKINSNEFSDNKIKTQSNIKHLDITLPSINLDTNLNGDYDNCLDDIDSGIKIIDSSKSDDEAIKKKSKHGFKIGMPDFNMPSFNIKGKPGKVSDDDDESVAVSKRENDISELNVMLPAINIKNDSQNVFDTNEAPSLEHFDIKLPDVSLPSLQLEGKINEVNLTGNELNLNTDVTKIDIDIPEYNLEEELKSEPEKELKEEKKKKSKHGFKIGMPDISVPSFSLKANSKTGKESTESTEGETKAVLDQDNMDISGVHLAITKPSLSLNEDYVLGGKSSDKGEENDHKPVRRLFSDQDSEKNQKDKKKSKEKLGFNFKFKGPEFSFPNFGNKYEKHSKVLESSEPSSLEADINIPKSEGFSNNCKESNEVTYDITLPKIPSASLNSKLCINDIDIEENNKLDINLPNDLSERLSSSKPKEVNVILNDTPDFKIPDLKIDKSEAQLNFKIPRIDMSHNLSSNTITTTEPGSCSNLPSELDLENYEIAGADYSLPDELKAEVTGRTDLEFGEGKLNFSEIKIPESKLIKISNPVEVNSEPSDDEMIDELNATDATKKKRFGIKVNTPNVSVPSFEIKQEDDEQNQSDEMKSFQMKYKLPSAHFVDLPSYEENVSDDSNLYVQLPRVKISKKDYLGKENTETENLSRPGVESSKISLNECDELKMKGGNTGVPTSNVSLLREKFNTKLKENKKLSGTKHKFELDTKLNSSNSNKFDFDIDEPEFLIPDLKKQPNYNSSFSPENFSISKLNAIEKDGVKLESSSRLSDYELNWKQKQEDLNSGSKMTNYESTLTSTPLNDVNISLDSSSVETESDLPEADSAYKKASRAFELDVPIPKLSMTKLNLEKSFHKDNEASIVKSEFQKSTLQEEEKDSFGNAFGFRGFKNHYEVEPKKDDNVNIDSGDINIELHSKHYDENSPNMRLINITSESKVEAMDLPEVDYDLDFETKSTLKEEKSIHLPEGDQYINYSIESKLKSLEESFNIKSSEIKIDSEVEKNRMNLGKNSSSIQCEIATESSKIFKEIPPKVRKEEDEDKSKSKMKLGLGFGFKGFSRSSDSEDNEVDTKISKEPEGGTNDTVEKTRSKTKKTFSFKGFGKSSSDTEEEHLDKVSDNPMQKSGAEEKGKFNKGSVNTGWKKSHRSSDSDDNLEIEKVDFNPQVESNLKKPKIKSNLGFGFKNKSKVSDQEGGNHAEIINEGKKEQNSPDEDIKMKSKGKIQLGLKGSKDSKYDTRSESEGGEDEKLTMDSRGDENRGKSKYGIGFGFRKNHGKNSSDSEGADNDEQKVHLDERGGNEKSKESKGKSLKLGFKGFKNLKGKIQTEINKMRHDSPSSDEDGNEENKNFNEKRKKVTKKKEKDKKIKRESEKYLDASEEATLASAAYAAKDNRRKKVDRESSSSSSSSESSSDDEEKSVEQKKKKKSKIKRKDDLKTLAQVIDVNTNIPQTSRKAIATNESVSSHISSEHFNSIQNASESHVTVVMSEPNQSIENVNTSSNKRVHMEMQSDPRNYVVVREMKLKENIQNESLNINHVDVEGTNGTNKLHQQFYLKQGKLSVNDSENGGFWGSDSDMERGKTTDTDVNLSSTSVALNTSGTQRVLTDSEELKRKATSLGDLSRLHEGILTGTLLERAVSLDLKNASVGPPNLHVRRLQLPDSSATSIDEVDESTVSPTSKKSDLGGFLKSASQWGTLEEAMHLGENNNSNRQMKVESTLSSPLVISQSTIVKTTTTDEGAPISSIEISGERGSSVTALSAKKPKWDDSFEDDEIPSLPSSPIPVEKTTITVIEDDRTTDSNEFSGSDPNIVVVGSEPVQAINNFHNLNYHLHPSIMPPYETNILSHHGRMSSSNTSINSDSGRYSPRHSSPGDRDDGGVTITMVPAEAHLNTHTVSSEHNVGHISSKASKILACPSELVNYDALQQSSMVTVSHDLLKENGEIITETTEHNVSDEYITPDTTPQKSMTQITLEGEGVSGYTVTEGTISRTVIISNPVTSSNVNVLQTFDQSNDHLS